MDKQTEKMIDALTQCQVALDVLACDVEDIFPGRAEHATKLAMRVREIVREAKQAAAK